MKKHVWFDILSLVFIILCVALIPSATANIASVCVVGVGVAYFGFESVRGVIRALKDDNYGF